MGGRNTSEFLQIVLSLVPSFIVAIDSLPAIDPHGGDVTAASEADFNLPQIQALIEGRPRGEEELERVEKATKVLDALGLERLSVADALRSLIGAHLAEPRFAIMPSDWKYPPSR